MLLLVLVDCWFSAKKGTYLVCHFLVSFQMLLPFSTLTLSYLIHSFRLVVWLLLAEVHLPFDRHQFLDVVVGFSSCRSIDSFWSITLSLWAPFCYQVLPQKRRLFSTFVCTNNKKNNNNNSNNMDFAWILFFCLLFFMVVESAWWPAVCWSLALILPIGK